MFTTIESWQSDEYAPLLDTMYRLRAKVFKTQLEWDVEVADGREKDAYDDFNPIYIVWCDDSRRVLYGSLRLLPTTGPTLLHDVFHETFPEDANLSAPGIWEGTRLCINEEAIQRDFPGMQPSRAFCVMLLALCEIALGAGIHTMISNYEPPTLRLYRMAGARIDVLGKSDNYGKRPVCAGAFEVSRDVLMEMRAKIGIPCSLFQPGHANWLVESATEAAEAA